MKTTTLAIDGRIVAAMMTFAGFAGAAEIHVAATGTDTNAGSAQEPLRTIQRAADLARPGDTITVHAGTYRERVNPPRGGESDAKRITYENPDGSPLRVATDYHGKMRDESNPTPGPFESPGGGSLLI